MTLSYQDFPAFRQLNSQQIQGFIEMCQVGKIAAGKRIISQNECGNRLFFVLSGDVRVYIETASGEQELSKISAPTVLGEIGFFSHQPNSANVDTLTTIKAIIMPYNLFRKKLCQGDPATAMIMLTLAETIADRAISMTQKVSELHERLHQSPVPELGEYTKDLCQWSFL